MTTHTLELLEALHRRCLNMAGMAQSAVRFAAEAVIRSDPDFARKVIELEDLIDAEEVAIERAALSLFALYSPAASDLRNVFAIVKVNIDLERIGDCATNIAQQVTRLTPSHEPIARNLRLIAESAVKQIDDTVRCLTAKDPDLARHITRNDDVIDALYNQILQELQTVSPITTLPPASAAANPRVSPSDLAAILIGKNFERIGDHCNNIAEDVIFLMKGQIVRHIHTA